MEIEGQLEEVRVMVKRGPIDNKFRELVIHPEFIRFEGGSSSNPYIEISKLSIKEYRFGLRWIDGFKFTIGREYQIFLKDDENQVLKIHFKSFYGIKKSDCHKLYSDILGNLWSHYFRDIANNFIQQFWANQEFSILGVIFNKDSLKIKKTGILREEVIEIQWDRVRTKEYQTYFVIYSVDDPAASNQSFSYLQDWNTDILYCVTKTIINNIDEKSVDTSILSG